MSLPEISRRSLLKTLGALVASPAGAVLAEPSRTWVGSDFSGFRQSANSILIMGQLSAQRSDGQFFRAMIPISILEIRRSGVQSLQRFLDLSPDSQLQIGGPIGEKIQLGLKFLNSFIDPRCDCRITGDREWTDEDGEYHYESLSHTCDLHLNPFPL